MEETHIKTESKNLEPSNILKETNVDVRRELIRKIGVERMIDKLSHKVIDSVKGKGNETIYELLSINFPDLPNCIYLKMLNPSIGCFHVEGVSRECKTVQQAINWRANNLIKEGENWEPAQLT
jgi:hypothetical protein